MPQLERHTFYIPDALVDEARKKGLVNLSQFVRESLKEYVNTPVTSCQTAGGSTSQNGRT